MRIIYAGLALLGGMTPGILYALYPQPEYLDLVSAVSFMTGMAGGAGAFFIMVWP